MSKFQSAVDLTNEAKLAIISHLIREDIKRGVDNEYEFEEEFED